jgi:hypothetical protein
MMSLQVGCVREGWKSVERSRELTEYSLEHVLIVLWEVTDRLCYRAAALGSKLACHPTALFREGDEYRSAVSSVWAPGHQPQLFEVVCC